MFVDSTPKSYACVQVLNTCQRANSGSVCKTVVFYSPRQARPLLPLWEEGWAKSGAHELLHAVLVGGGEEKPAAARVELVELSSKIADVFQAKCLWEKEEGR